MKTPFYYFMVSTSATATATSSKLNEGATLSNWPRAKNGAKLTQLIGAVSRFSLLRKFSTNSSFLVYQLYDCVPATARR